MPALLRANAVPGCVLEATDTHPAAELRLALTGTESQGTGSRSQHPLASQVKHPISRIDAARCRASESILQ